MISHISTSEESGVLPYADTMIRNRRKGRPGRPLKKKKKSLFELFSICSRRRARGKCGSKQPKKESARSISIHARKAGLMGDQTRSFQRKKKKEINHATPKREQIRVQVHLRKNAVTSQKIGLEVEGEEGPNR